ncbi:MAG: PA2778 family cysteine peptidase [Gammaproteobacteria bacterium]
MRLSATLALCLLMLGCATPQTRRLMESPPATLPAKILLEDVSFLSQQTYYCGPAALAMTMNYHGLDISQQALARAVYVPELKGSLQAEMLSATRSEGFLAYVLAPELRSLLAEIAAGHPVVVLQNLGVSWYPVWHYAVAIGYDLDAGELILHSGDNAYYRAALRVFERTWARGDYWALAPLPPNVMPRDDNPLRFLQAAAALEETGHTRAAREAYTAATRRWPDNLVAHMGVGNTRYAAGDVRGAARAFAIATALAPDSGAAHNNLAVSLSALGCDGAALAAARRAIAVDIDSDPRFRETLDEVRVAATGGPAPERCARFDATDARQTHFH